MSTINELRDGIDYVEAELATIHQTADGRDLEPDEQTRWDEGQDYLTDARAELEQAEAKLTEERAALAKRVEEGRSKPKPGFQADNFQHRRAPDPSDVLNDRSATPAQLIDAVTRNVEETGADLTQIRTVLRRHRLDTMWSRNLLARSTDVYASAFEKYLTGREMVLTPEERAALAVGTNTAGGYLVPTHLDPTIILTNDGSANVMRPLARVVTLTDGSNQWNGVSSAGVTASWDTELAEVSDDSPAVAQPAVPVYKAQAFVQASFEALQDISGLGTDVMMMFADARDRLEGAAHQTGTGSDQPTGIFTAVDAAGNETVTTTAATIGLVDLQATRRAVGQRWRNRSTWLTNPEWGDEIKRLGAALSASYSTDITESNTERLLGRPIVETDDAPNDATTTALDQRVIFGDLSNYVIVDKPGSLSVSFIPHLFNTSNNLPDGRAGWHAYWRTGADSVNDAAFQLLMDKTSA